MMTSGSLIGNTAVFDKMVDSVAAYERDGTIRYVNPATCQLFGRSREALLGQVLWLVFPEARGNPFHRAFEHVARSGDTQHVEHFYPPRGRWHDQQVYLADERIWVIARDISDEKQAALRLDVLADASRVFAGAAADVRSGFEGIARHVAELMGDMCSIRLLSADAATFEAPLGIWDVHPAYRELLQNNPSVASSEAIGPIILGSGEAFVMTSIDPASIAEQIAPSERRRLVEQLGIHSVMVVPSRAEARVLGILSVCRRQTGTRAPYADEDLELLEELADTDALPVLVSLVDDQRRPIDVVLADHDERVSITVRDQGIGIAPEDRARVLGRFERAVSSSHYGGLGLGLYIANEIARAHGGAIVIDSQPGKGATFTFTLPRQKLPG